MKACLTELWSHSGTPSRFFLLFFFFLTFVLDIYFITHHKRWYMSVFPFFAKPSIIRQETLSRFFSWEKRLFFLGVVQVLGNRPAVWSTAVTHVQGSQRSSVGSISATPAKFGNGKGLFAHPGSPPIKRPIPWALCFCGAWHRSYWRHQHVHLLPKAPEIPPRFLGLLPPCPFIHIYLNSLHTPEFSKIPFRSARLSNLQHGNCFMRQAGPKSRGGSASPLLLK